MDKEKNGYKEKKQSKSEPQQPKIRVEQQQQEQQVAFLWLSIPIESSPSTYRAHFEAVSLLNMIFQGFLLVLRLYH